jgi:hypothetical protein
MSQAFRFGVQDPEALKAIDMAFELAPAPSSDIYKGAMKTLTLVRSLACLVADTIRCVCRSARFPRRSLATYVYVSDTSDFARLDCRCHASESPAQLGESMTPCA